MKAILEFDLPTEQAEFNLATNGHHYQSVLYEIYMHLRNELKYNDSLPDNCVEALEKVRDIMSDELLSRNIGLFD